eukprot:TRINITY_DN5330_c0_g2_i1.p1 TRINITY_DN5330_c0_g2~~TRINITY_DN5330_c0_g2_i1.p1  ORF type:complete len:547 (-),score=173.73 TRINITY_DN5330_c0_g2_i1:77-1717(-)
MQRNISFLPKMKFLFITLVVGAIFGLVHCSDDELLQPLSSSTGPEMAMLLFQGAQIGADQYVPLAQEIQKASSSNMRLWVAIPAAPLDIENPFSITGAAQRAKDTLAAAGYNKTEYIVAGHSLGGVSIQDYSEKNPAGIIAQVLMGSALQRKYRGKNYPIPTLTIAGELDGLFRVTRVAEEFYNAITLGKMGKATSAAKTDFPVIVVPGMNHFQWASGPVPALVKASDLKSELLEQDAHVAGAHAIVSFIGTQLGIMSSATKLIGLVDETSDFVEPIAKAYELEGSRQFNAPEQKGGPQENCPKGGCVGIGSQWATIAQDFIADESVFDAKGLKLNITNEFVELSSTPPFGAFHLPNITVNAEDPNTRDLPTYSQCSWESLDGLDTGFVATSATEIATKMLSRQCSKIRGAGYTEADAPFTLDDPDFCAIINKNAFKWALNNAAEKTRARFQKMGQRYTFGPDQAKIGGPFWIDAILSFNSTTLATGEKVIEISSPMIKTSYDYPKFPFLPDPSCYHYCKLLSPARATEWIYVDGLRLNGGLASSQ